MINGKTYYQILGVLDDAEDIVIRAAYKSLSSKYHPDKWIGDKSFANEKMSEINRAYETLSDTKKRARYDDEISDSKSGNSYEESTDSGNFDEFFADSDEDWRFATEFFPDAEQYFQKLKKFSPYLALAYRQKLLETKDFKSLKDIYRVAKNIYLERFFGTDSLTKVIAENLLTKGRKDVALEINKAVRIMGDSVPPSVMLKKVLDKFFLRESAVDTFSKVVESKSAEDYKTAFRYLNYTLRTEKNIKDETVFTVVEINDPNNRVIVKSIIELNSVLTNKMELWLERMPP